MSLLIEHSRISANPLDLFEELVAANDWIHDRSSDSELIVQVAGQWCDYNVCALWQSDIGAMYLSCHLEARVAVTRRAAVFELLAAANERLWLGHFDYSPEDGAVLFRHTIPLRGTSGISVEQLEDLLDTALLECERLYPALQMVVWGGRPVEEALTAAMMDTVGEA
ncbi:YbjN domain-containing protein [Fodinicurvata halophila]|uniref:YbjN domain-containing protein n=1 Tax=Fodinicurvata halophila TaxID=1419723 RepID=A0ABV8UQI6_9PROT